MKSTCAWEKFLAFLPLLCVFQFYTTLQLLVISLEVLFRRQTVKETSSRSTKHVRNNNPQYYCKSAVSWNSKKQSMGYFWRVDHNILWNKVNPWGQAFLKSEIEYNKKNQSWSYVKMVSQCLWNFNFCIHIPTYLDMDVYMCIWDCECVSGLTS